MFEAQCNKIGRSLGCCDGSAVALQGILWVKEREAKNNLKVVRMGAPDTATKMERAIEAGHSVLIENMGESIDAVLNPVITRSTFKKVTISVTLSGGASSPFHQQSSCACCSTLLRCLY